MTRIDRPALAVLIVAGALISPALIRVPQAHAATIYACVKKQTGSVRVVSRSAKCRKGEKKLVWDSLGASGPQGARGAPGSQGSPGFPGTAGLQGVPGPGARVATANTASSDPATQTLFTYGGDSIGVTCGLEGDPSYAAFDIEGDNVEAFGSTSIVVDEGTPSYLDVPSFGLLAPGAKYTSFDGISPGAKAGNSAISSTQLTALEAGPGALDFHMDLALEVKDVSSSYSECKFAAMYYPVASG
jgi:hypothetical protein